MVVTDHCARFRASEPKSQAHANHKVGYHAHLSEVRCDHTGERSFMHVAVRTTFRFHAADGIDLSTERDVLFVALDEAKRERALDEEAAVPPSQKSWFAFGGAP